MTPDHEETTPASDTAATADTTPAAETAPTGAGPESTDPETTAPETTAPETTQPETAEPAAGQQSSPAAEAEPHAAGESAKAAESSGGPGFADPFAIPSEVSLLFRAPAPEEVEAARHAAAHDEEDDEEDPDARTEETLEDGKVVSRRRRRRRRGQEDMELVGGVEGDPTHTVTKVRTPRLPDSSASDTVTSVKGSTRLEAKRQRRRDSRATGRRRQVITEAEFLARRESVDRQMVVRQNGERIQIGVLEDGVLAEHFVSETQQDSLIGNVYLGKVQNVLPSMEAAFVDIGRGRNAVLYAGEVNWDASGLDKAPRRIENALKSGDSVLVQVTKDPIGHKGARLTSQISLPGRFLVYVPGGSMTGISRKLPDVERQRLKKILKDRLPEGAGVIVRTAAEGAAEEELAHDINRLRAQWEEIQAKSSAKKVLAPELLYQEPDLTIKTVRDVFNEDFSAMVVQGEEAWDNIEAYVMYVAPDLIGRLKKWEEDEDVFAHYRIEEGLAKALDRKVYLPSGGSLVIDRTEAMTVVDVNTGKFTGSGGNLEETVTKNNLEAAEEIVRQLRLRDIGGIIVIDFIDMVLESNRDLVLRRLVECLGRDRTKHQVAEVTSLGLVQMTRKRMGTGLLEVFSEPCEHCEGRGVVVHDQPLRGSSGPGHLEESGGSRQDRKRGRGGRQRSKEQDDPRAESTRHAVASIAAASRHAEDEDSAGGDEAREHTESRSSRRSDHAAGQDQAGRGRSGADHAGARAGAEDSEQEGSGESGRRRRRRKRGRGQQEQHESVSGASATDGQAPAGTDQQEAAHGLEDDPDMVVTIQGEVVTLPHGQQGEAPRGRGGRRRASSDGSAVTLESLSKAFEEAPEDEDAESTVPERGGRGSRRGSRRASSGGRRDTETQAQDRQESGEPESSQQANEQQTNAQQANEEKDVAEQGGASRPSGRDRARAARVQARLEQTGTRTGPEAAEEARRAALEAIEDMRPGRRGKSSGGSRDSRRGRGSGAEEKSSRAGRSGQQDAGDRPADRTPRRSRRAQSPAGTSSANTSSAGGSSTGVSADSHGGTAPKAAAPLTGVATPGASRAAAEAPEQAPAAPAAVAPAPAPRKRRTRRAASGGGTGGAVSTGSAGAAQGGAVSSASAAAAPSQHAADEVTMLGVGVRAQEIKRAQ